MGTEPGGQKVDEGGRKKGEKGVEDKLKKTEKLRQKKGERKVKGDKQKKEERKRRETGERSIEDDKEEERQDSRNEQRSIKTRPQKASKR